MELSKFVYDLLISNPLLLTDRSLPRKEERECVSTETLEQRSGVRCGTQTGPCDSIPTQLSPPPPSCHESTPTHHHLTQDPIISHTHTHTHTHARAHTRTHIHTHTRTTTHTNTLSFPLTPKDNFIKNKVLSWICAGNYSFLYECGPGPALWPLLGCR